MNVGPTVPFSEEMHAAKYRGEGESFRESVNRVASALSDGQAHYLDLREVLLDMRFMPAGRVQTAMGSPKTVTPYNCFVSGTIEDSFVEGSGSIMQRATEAAATMRMGGGIGYDFSTLRPRGALIRKLMSQASGPVSFMSIYDAVCRCVASSGHRRGAQMGVLRVDHPDIFDFIHAKQNSDRLTGFNVSVAVTDEFMHALLGGEKFDLRFGGEVYRTVDPGDIWEALMRSTWDWAEPGVLFIDTINRMNNLWYCEQIAATNPCGEQPLPPHGACLLGSFNLVRYVEKEVGSASRYIFNWGQFRRDIPPVVRGMDNVVDRAVYPLEAQAREARSKRRMGLGVTGLANAGEALGLLYGSADFLAFEAQVLEVLRDCAYTCSVELAEEKGPFPLFDEDRYLNAPFVAGLPDSLREAIFQFGIRNSHLLSIAPTGTISLCADNVSSGIEPVFALSFDRSVVEFDGVRTETVRDYGHRVFGVRGKTADRVQVAEHLDVLSTAYRFVDSAVSKTCNVPSDTPWSEFKGLYEEAWRRGCKGCTTFQVGGRRSGIFNVREDDSQSEASDPVCRIDPDTGRRECE